MNLTSTTTTTVDKKIFATIEALLFASGEPVDISRLSEVLEIEKRDLRDIMTEFAKKYQNQNRGIMVLQIDDSYELCTKKQYSDKIKQLLDIKKNSPLTDSAMEVLAIIAYNEPVTKAFVEQVRGIDSNHLVNSLLIKGLIKENGRLDVPGKPILYKTTKNFLRSFNMQNLSELPKIPENLENLDNLDFSQITEKQ